MLYYLFNYLQKVNFPGARVFNYVTFRAAVAIILALVISVWFGNWFIKMLKRKKITETQRDESIDPYNTKKVGVPTTPRKSACPPWVASSSSPPS